MPSCGPLDAGACKTLGITHAEQLPRVVGAHSGPLLVMGAGRCLWDDLERVSHLHWRGAKMPVNLTGAFYGRPFDHWATLHSDRYASMIERHRSLCGLRPEQLPPIHDHKDGRLAKHVWRIDRLNGSSALFAATIGLCMGYTPIVLAGCPMDNTGHFYDPPWRDTNFDVDHVRDAWGRAAPVLIEHGVRSLSGRTRDWLGEPA